MKEMAGRNLSGEEQEWIGRAHYRAISAGNVIAQLADILEITFDLYHAPGIDDINRTKLCEDGAVTIAQAIQELAKVVTEQQEEISDIISGQRMVEMKGRREFLGLKHPSFTPCPPCR